MQKILKQFLNKKNYLEFINYPIVTDNYSIHTVLLFHKLGL